MKRKIISIFLNISITTTSLLICFIVGESVIRITKTGYLSERSLMFSSQSFQLDLGGAVRYLPNENIRTVAVYNGRIEYDVSFQTNNLGLIDSIDYKYETIPDKSYYVFVGDSFTAGFHGGKAWVPTLRSKVNNQIEIYNLGVSGAGIEHFYRLLKSAKEQVNITHIVILALSDDFQRRFWYPLTNKDEIHFCREKRKKTNCINDKYIARVINPNLTEEDLLKISKNVAKDKKVLGQSFGIKEYAKKSYLLTFIYRASRDLFKTSKQMDNIKYSLASLRRIKKTFPFAEVYFIHLPQKQEVKTNKYMLDTIGKEIEKIGLKYYPALRKCEWTDYMFFTNDSHPNNLGYKAITSCVSDYLFS